MVFDPFEVVGDKPLKFPQQKALNHHKSFDIFCPTDRQTSFEQNSVKAEYCSGDFLCVIIDKVFVSFLLLWVLRDYHISE